MALEDPFLIVKDEVTKALNRTRGLYQQWHQLQCSGISFCQDETQKTTTELCNSIRSIEWDLEDLEDTIGIVEKNPSRFRLNGAELVQRRFFVQQTRDEVGHIKEKLKMMRDHDTDRSAKKPLLENSSPVRVTPKKTMTGYVRVPIQGDQDDVEHGSLFRDVVQQQASLVKQQDDQLVLISGSVGTLKSMSRQIRTELDEQALILDDMVHEMENAETKMDTTLKKMAKVLRLSNDKRQWMAIGVLTGLMVVVIVLFYVL